MRICARVAAYPGVFERKLSQVSIGTLYSRAKLTVKFRHFPSMTRFHAVFQASKMMEWE